MAKHTYFHVEDGGIRFADEIDKRLHTNPLPSLAPLYEMVWEEFCIESAGD